MFCQNCGKENKEEAKFCSSCGTETAKPPTEEKKVIDSPQEKKTNVTGGVIDQVVRFGSIIFGFVIGKYLGVVLILFIAAYIAGDWFSKWYSKKERANPALVKWIVWSNVLTWLLPPLGIATGFAALEFSNHFPGDRKKYKTLAIIGIALSMLNALSGVLMNV